MSEVIKRTERTELKRQPRRGSFERETIYRILDEGIVAHVGFTVDDQPFVIPTAYARDGEQILIHGSAASRMMRALGWEKDVCVTVALIDGLVLARSAFHHSINYRSVMIFGKARTISDEAEKLKALEAFTEHLVPGRWAEVRPPNQKELKATTIASLSLAEASAKIRAGHPSDDAEDYLSKVWAGVIPLELSPKKPVDDAKLEKGIEPPRYVSHYKRGKDE